MNDRMNIVSEEIIVEGRDAMRAQGAANNNFQQALDKAHQIYREGWRPVYLVPDDVSTIKVARADADMTIAN